MPAPIIWTIYDANSDPLPGLVIGPAGVRFVDFVTRGLVDRTPPTIVELGGGRYGAQPTDADAEVGVCYLIDNGPDAYPPRLAGEVVGEIPHAVWHLEDDTGALWTGAAPTIAAGNYGNVAGPRASPGIVAVRPYLFSVTPTLADLLAGVSFLADSPTGASPPHVDEIFGLAGGAPPQVTVVSPAEGSAILPADPLVVDVIDGVAILRSVVAVRFPNGDEEIVHTGDRFASRYTSGARAAISGGWRYTIRRNGGWVQAPTLDVYAIDSSGREATEP